MTMLSTKEAGFLKRKKEAKKEKRVGLWKTLRVSHSPTPQTSNNMFYLYKKTDNLFQDETVSLLSHVCVVLIRVDTHGGHNESGRIKETGTQRLFVVRYEHSYLSKAV